jgi:large subunit ribosomal protein L10
MSKPIKELIIRDYKTKLGDATDGMLINIRGVNAIGTTKIRSKLGKKQIKVTVVRNALAKKAIDGSGLQPLAKLLAGPSAMVFGGSSVVEVAREIVGLLKEFPTIELKGAVLDGTLYEGKAGIEELSKFPTKGEAIAKVVTLVVSPGRKLIGQITGPASTLAGVIKAIEAKLEKGEAITKKAG